MPPKAKLPQPIDRPLSRAYLREFSGWSTAYPPGLSEPTSLRIMENVLIGRDGACQIRPGLRNISYHEDTSLPMSEDWEWVGNMEPFFLDTGEKAYLFAARGDGFGTPGEGVDFFVLDPTLAGAGLPYGIYPAQDYFADLDLDNTRFTADTTYVKYLQIDNKIIALNDQGEELRIFYVDTPKRVVRPNLINRPSWTVANQLEIRHPDNAWVAGAQTAWDPTGETPGAATLVSSTAANNVYNIGLFYTYFNELGESAPSQVKVIKVMRPWSGWLQGPGTTPDKYDDQLIARIQGSPGYFEFVETVETDGALGAYLYMATWKDGEPIPVEALLVDTITFTDGSAYGTTPFDATEAGNWWNAEGWFQLTAAVGLAARTVPMPSLETRRNYTDPSRGGQGIVAADRMVLVNDPTQPAVIRWTSNQQGEYINFSASRGGGFKTLTSGNLQVPSAVVLWQNPQSVDTLCILCRGVDGKSTGYYMAPAEITSQSESTSIMGFEETTASPGTASPYGNEVFNNALLHPLEDQLMKSTAANYAIRHKSLTDLISPQWRGLIKEWIISAEHDGRIYYIVNNPEGVALETGCKGNEVWILDAQAESPSWSRWLVQGVSLSKIELDGVVYMSLMRPDGLFLFDPAKNDDDVIVDGVIDTTPIAWRIETNTQGANRAHDAWARLQLAQISLGNFLGTMEWGVRGWDHNGKVVDVRKKTQHHNPDAESDALPWDLEDQLQVRRDMKEWFFYASSWTNEADVVQSSSGQINMLQYRYAPVTVNVGYEMGSVETFEYGRALASGGVQLTDNGVPTPFNEQSRP